MPEVQRYDLIVIGSGPAGRRAAIQAAKLDRSVLVIEKRPPGRRRLGAHRHDPVQDPARDGAQPLRLARARLLRPRLPGEEGHRGRGPAPAPAHDARPRGRGARAPVRPQRRARRCAARRASSIRTGSRSTGRARRDAQLFEADALRASRSAPRPFRPDYMPFDGEHVLDSDEILDLKPHAAQPDGGRRRRHRRRVRHHLLRARRAGDADRAARDHARLHRPRAHRRVHPRPARPRHRVPARLQGRAGSSATERRLHDPARRRPRGAHRHAAVRRRARWARPTTSDLDAVRPRGRRSRPAHGRSEDASRPRCRTSTPPAT